MEMYGQYIKLPQVENDEELMNLAVQYFPKLAGQVTEANKICNLNFDTLTFILKSNGNMVPTFAWKCEAKEVVTDDQQRIG